MGALRSAVQKRRPMGCVWVHCVGGGGVCELLKAIQGAAVEQEGGTGKRRAGRAQGHHINDHIHRPQPVGRRRARGRQPGTDRSASRSCLV